MPTANTLHECVSEQPTARALDWPEIEVIPARHAPTGCGGVEAAVAGAPEAAATAAWAAVHGVASLASRGVLDLVGTDAQELLDQILPQD